MRCGQHLRLIASTIGFCALLAACGGGSGGLTPPVGSQPTPTSTATAAASTTNASGTVVNDANGAPLAGVSVKLMPWAPCGPTPSPATSITPESDGCPTPLPSPQATTAANGTFTLNGAPNGHYLLIIGNDTVSTPPPGYAPPTCTTACGTPTPAPFTVAATVHDNVTLSGGSQTLKAPTLPSVASGYNAPTWETNGDYRLATLNAQTEMPCYIAWQYERAQNGLAGTSVDEWLTEAVRAQLGYVVANDGGTISFLTTGNINTSGGSSCSEAMIAFAFNGQNDYATDPRAIWFGGQWLLWQKQGTSFYQGLGLAQFPIDPRSLTDTNHPIWP
jgi:hypothetical protein